MNEDDTTPTVEVIVNSMTDALVTTLADVGQRYYEQQIIMGRPPVRARHDTDTYIDGIRRAVMKQLRERLRDRPSPDYAYPGIPWHRGEYADHFGDGATVEEERTSLQAMAQRYEGDAEDVYALLPGLQIERARLFANGMSYGAIAKQAGLSASAVAGSVARIGWSLDQLGRAAPGEPDDHMRV